VSNGKIATTGDLREFLATLLVEVTDGTVDTDRASKAHRLAQQINESLYAEIKVQRIRAEMGAEVEPNFGGLQLGNRRR
jgi:hypothetical protein